MAARSAEDQTVELPLRSVAKVSSGRSGRILLLTNEVFEVGEGGISPSRAADTLLRRSTPVGELAADASRRVTKIR